MTQNRLKIFQLARLHKKFSSWVTLTPADGGLCTPGDVDDVKVGVSLPMSHPLQHLLFQLPQHNMRVAVQPRSPAQGGDSKDDAAKIKISMRLSAEAHTD